MKQYVGFSIKVSALLFMLVGNVFAETTATTCTQDCSAPFVPNQFWTTAYGPAYADIGLSPTNFLTCSSSSYALCYYSGPDGQTIGKDGKPLPSLPCKTSKDDPNSADCRCYVESGTSYIDINSIRNTEAYIETIRACGLNGEKCKNMASDAAEKRASASGKTPTTLPTAPVCNYIQANESGKVAMEPKAELISTFSLAEIKNYGNGHTDCTTTAAPYAGCMTASCTYEVDKDGKQTGFANCNCPVYTGPFQIGVANVSCNAGTGNVWSAAYTPPKK